MPLRVPKYLHVIVRPVLDDHGELRMKKNKSGNEVPVTKRITVLPGKPFKFSAQEIADIEGSHGDVLARAFGVIPDADEPEALPGGPAVKTGEEGEKFPDDDEI